MCEGMIFFLIICALVTLLALTNRILVVCYVKLLEKHVLMLFFRHVLCLTLEFSFCSVYYYFN